MLKFYIDAHLSKEIAIQLRRKGVDTIHCSEIGMDEADDPEHIAYAADEGRILVSCDKGIVFGHHLTWQVAGKTHAGIILISGHDCQGERSIGIVVNGVLFLDQAVIEGAAIYSEDLYNKVWRL